MLGIEPNHLSQRAGCHLRRRPYLAIGRDACSRDVVRIDLHEQVREGAIDRAECGGDRGFVASELPLEHREGQIRRQPRIDVAPGVLDGPPRDRLTIGRKIGVVVARRLEIAEIVGGGRQHLYARQSIGEQDAALRVDVEAAPAREERRAEKREHDDRKGDRGRSRRTALVLQGGLVHIVLFPNGNAVTAGETFL